VKDKSCIRYLGFRTAHKGGRLFDFHVSEAGSANNNLTTFEIPAGLFTGDYRIRLQEGVGICYAMLKHLLEIGGLADLPKALRLTASDVSQYREKQHGPNSRSTHTQSD